MKYKVFVSGAPKSRAESDVADADAYGVGGTAAHHEAGGRQRGGGAYGKSAPHPGGSGHSRPDAGNHHGGDGAAYANHGGAPVLRRFPPVIQFLTEIDPMVQHQLQKLSVEAHRQGKNLQEVCQELYVYARSIGYVLTLGVQEVFSNQMPSFPQQTVHSALLMVDVERISAPEGYHGGRVTV